MKGRPTDYDESYCEKLIQHMSKGLSFESFGAQVDAGRRTLFDWLEKHDDFKKAKGIGENKGLEFYEKLLALKVTGSSKNKIDNTLLIFAMKTRYHKIYGDRIKHELEEQDELDFTT